MNMESVQFEVDHNVVNSVYRQLTYRRGVRSDVIGSVSRNISETCFDRWLLVVPTLNLIDAFRRENGELCVIHQRALMK